MTAEIHQLKPKPVVTNWMCSACGVDAGCNCGAPLISKMQRIADFDAANPGKSTRQVADALGDVNQTDVVRSRKKSGETTVSPETVTGKDGKSYPSRRTPVRRLEDGEDFTEEQSAEGNKNLFFIRADEAKKFAFYEGEADDQVLKFAKATAEAWCNLVENLMRRK